MLRRRHLGSTGPVIGNLGCLCFLLQVSASEAGERLNYLLLHSNTKTFQVQMLLLYTIALHSRLSVGTETLQLRGRSLLFSNEIR